MNNGKSQIVHVVIQLTMSEAVKSREFQHLSAVSDAVKNQQFQHLSAVNVETLVATHHWNDLVTNLHSTDSAFYDTPTLNPVMCDTESPNPVMCDLSILWIVRWMWVVRWMTELQLLTSLEKVQGK